MNILFIVTGIGLGHSVREHSIIRKILKKNPGTRIKILGFNVSYDYFKREGFDVGRIYGHSFQGNQLKVNNFKMMLFNLTYPFKFIVNSFIALSAAKKFKPDVIVCDAQPEGVFIGKLMGKRVVLVYNLDLRAENLGGGFGGIAKIMKNVFYPMLDKVVNPQLWNINKKEGKVIMTPPVVRQTINELPSVKKLMKKLGFKKEPIIVQIGGSNFGSSMVKNLVKVSTDFPDEKFVVFGYNRKKRR